MVRRKKRGLKKFMSMAVVFCMAAAIWQIPATDVQAAAKIPISSAEDFMNIADNPSGSYYLTKDITLPKDMEMLFPYGYDETTQKIPNNPQFTGTLDGKGHKLKGFTYKGPGGPVENPIALIGCAKGATFKNLSVTGVNISVNAGEKAAYVSGFVGESEDCKYDNVKVSGTITVKGNSSAQCGEQYYAFGLCGGRGNTLRKCSSSVKIKMNVGRAYTLTASGLANGIAESIKDCSFKGSITASAKASKGSWAGDKGFLTTGICTNVSNKKVSGCVNSGNITLKVDKGTTDSLNSQASLAAYGIGPGKALTVSSCGNSGTIKLVAPKIGGVEARVAGIMEQSHNGGKVSTSKCWNTGNLSVTTKDDARVAGICLDTTSMSQSYNTGSISGTSGQVGGLCLDINKMNNCYNAGKVTMKGKGHAAGLAKHIDAFGNTTCNYSIGKVTAPKGWYSAALFIEYEGNEMIMDNKCVIFDNYYAGNSNAYGIGGQHDPLKSDPKAKKISSATSASCPKLSSKYWTYSSKHKRLILKNNKEK